MGITLCDHIIFAGDSYYSFAQHDLFTYIDGTIDKFIKEGAKFYEIPDLLNEAAIDPKIFGKIKIKDESFLSERLDEKKKD